MDYFDYSEPSSFDIEKFLEESQEQERQRLEEELGRIDEQLERRDTIHRETIDSLESKLDWYIERLEKLYKQCRGKTGQRGELKEGIRELYSEIRLENRGHWKDRQELERERRELIRSLGELDDSEDIFDLL